MIKFDVFNHFSGAVQFTAEIDATDLTARSVRLALAIKWAIASRANLYEADLSGADLSGANLSGADLYEANLSGANLSGADLYEAKNVELMVARTRILPEGTLIGWKKCRSGVIVKLRIPEEAARTHAFGRKCRAQFVDVLEVYGADEGVSSHDGQTKYKVGERVTCDVWGEDWTVECSGGIHFFITREEAEAY